MKQVRHRNGLACVFRDSVLFTNCCRYPFRTRADKMGRTKGYRTGFDDKQHNTFGSDQTLSQLPMMKKEEIRTYFAGVLLDIVSVTIHTYK